MAADEDGALKARRWYTPLLLLAPGVLFLTLFFLIPMARMFQLSLEDGGLSNYSDVFTDNSETIVRTFVYAALATLGCIALGFPLAYFIAFKGGRWKNFLLALVVLPFFVTYLVRTLAWKILLFDDGPIVALLQWIGILGADGRLLGEPIAVIGALTYNFLPFMVLPIYVALEKMDRRLVEASADLYGSPWRSFRKVTLRVALPGVFAGTLLVFIPAAGDFVNSELLGSEKTVMIGNVIERNFGRDFFRPELSALSFTLMAIILIGVLIYARALGTDELV